ncbi:hypothetical protein DFH07DRAFT_433438 [Mycena maculata]|uniref:Velvet domain-containing protein n=1 Tax=Mycena maculata TaxID=230809 RepID=A0AAD7KCU6_9AGAR|nr:hypothetical protein DFH07DRAFT_433438 [Mycena maculata]
MTSLAIAIEEIQPPQRGRKSHTTDPRPLDPLPVIQLHFYSPTCESHFREATYLQPPTSNLWAKAQLFRVPPPSAAPANGQEWTYYVSQGVDRSTGQLVFGLMRTPLPPHGARIEAQYGNHLILASAEESHLLHGERAVQARIKPGGDYIVFAFPNLGVLQTGHYVLCYKVFAHSSPTPAPIATCFGAPFTIFTSAQFPGLLPTTPLTASLASLNIPGVHNRRPRE